MSITAQLINSPEDVVERAALDAQTAAAGTRLLRARRGRASYIGEAAEGVTDPGAATVALFFEAGAATITEGRP
jgi:dihydroxyacetone kinase-like protein